MFASQDAIEDVPLDRDDFKEESRRLMRVTFDFDRWAAHRSTNRYQRHVISMLSSRLVVSLAQPLLFIAGVSTAVAGFHTLCDLHYIEPIPQFSLDSTEPFSLTSFALALLLVFRTNTSYSRWLDARKAWGSLINRSRDITRQYLIFYGDDSDVDTILSVQEEKGERKGDEGEMKRHQYLKDMFGRWVIAFSICLKCHLRENEDSILELAKLNMFSRQELAALSAANHKPNYALHILSHLIKRGAKTHQNFVGAAYNMDMNLTQLQDVVGTCERILRTPIPLSYTRHTSRFMLIWLTFLPFALYETCRWAVVPVSILLSFSVLAIEDVGVQVEEPFSILPLEDLCDTIIENVQELYKIDETQKQEIFKNSSLL